jgi:hypothetical protein
VRDERRAAAALVDAAPRLERLDAAHCGLRNVDAVVGLDSADAAQSAVQRDRVGARGAVRVLAARGAAICRSTRACRPCPTRWRSAPCDETTALELFVDLTPVGALPQQRPPPFTASSARRLALPRCSAAGRRRRTR